MPKNSGQQKERRRRVLRVHVEKLNALYERFAAHRSQWLEFFPVLKRENGDALNFEDFQSDILQQMKAGEDFARRHRALLRNYQIFL